MTIGNEVAKNNGKDNVEGSTKGQLSFMILEVGVSWLTLVLSDSEFSPPSRAR